MKAQVDKKSSETPAYAIRDLIWFLTDNLHLPCILKKL